ncbi:hypothetical protein F2P81_023738, partial [Scophthalmus maximus]
PAGQWNYIIDIVVNASNAEALEQIRASLNATDLPIQLDSHTEISDVSITTVCYSTGTGFQCRCEEQFAWPYSTCVTYGACDQTWSGICKCINAIPAGNQSCQPISGLLTRYEYEVEVELNVTDVGTVDYLRSLLNNNSFSLALGPVVNVTDIDITTVCYPNGTNFQCRCEDQNVWSYRDCLTYGACDEITSDTCRCINSIPSSGRYCQPNTVVQLYEYIVEVEIHVSDDAQIVQLRHALENISFPVRLSNTVNITQIDIIFTVTPVTYEYQIYIEMNTTDADQLRNTLKNMTFPVQIGTQINISDVDMINDLTVCPLTTPAPPAVYKYLISVELNVSVVGLIDQLRTILSNISYPISIGNHIQISHVNMSTVCYPNSSTYQCRCEEQFRWPCHMCSTFGKCNDTFDNSCGCINAIPPDGQYCQSVDQYNLTSCPVTTPTPSATNLTSCPITTPSPTTSPVIYEYVISIELNTTDVAVMDRLRNISYPVGIGNDIQVLHINISTVCYPSSGGYQCRCEDQYRWSCDQCLTYGSCDNIMYDTCGCISAILPDGQYCQPVDHHTVSPAVYKYLISIELNVSDVTLIDRLRTILSNNSYPISISNRIQISLVNMSTVCYSNSSAYQCRCEEQFRWPCHMCSTFGKCNDAFDYSCGCINAIPPDGQYCQPLTDSTPATAIATTPSVATTTNVTSQNTTIGSTILEVPSTGLISTTSNTATTHVPNTPVTTFNTTTPTTTTTTAATTTPTTTTTTSTTITPSKITSTAATASATTTFTTTNTTITTSPTAATIIHTNTSATTTTITQTSTVFSVEMLMRLDKEYTTELNNPSSAVFKNFKSQIDSVLHEQYKGIPGYISGFVTRFSEGSVITDFVVQTTYVDFDKLAEENEKLPETIQPVAPVIGSVSAFYKSPTSITIPDLTYTGNTMFLRCEPPENFDLGLISSSRWKFKGREIKDGERIEITTSNNQSMLKVINIIPADRGLYSCTLRNKTININQEGFVTETQIIQAPVVRLQGEVNVRCQNGQIQPLKCCVQRPYTVKWFQGIVPLNSVPVTEGKANCIKHDYKLENCSGSQEDKITFICRVDNPSSYEMKMTMTIFRDKSKCDDAQYGTGRVGDRSSIGCDEGQEGSKTAICQETGEWKLEVDTCIVTQIKELLIDSQDLVVEEVPQFVLNLSTVVQQEKTEIANSSATISAIVDILNTIANVSTAVNKTVMQNVLETIDVLISEDARDSWLILNANDSRNTSSALLGSMETLSSDLDGEFAIATQRILLNRTTFNNNFMADLNSSVVIDIPNTSMSNIFITTILLSTLNNVMPPRNSTFDVTLFNATSNETAINAVVVLIKINATVQKVLLRYNKLNSSLTLNPQCVFWNFTLFDNFGAWDDEGCTFVSDINNTVTCSCNHLTSFSILMATDIPPSLSEALDIITYFGVGISLASLVICLIIEGYVWKAITRNSTAFIRHVSLVNTALSLLIADICFIIGAFIAKNPLENPGEDYELPLGLCSTATFFMHFFYLALFFWMLVSGLLLFYRTVMVFSYMSKSAMLAIGFCLGYGCPLIIAVITVAVTAPGNGYIRKDNACWLNWIETKALLALVIPALTIVLINIFIVIVVLFKMLRRGVGESAQTDEKHTLVVIARCVIILTPLFGLTWSLGVGTMVSSTSKGLHIAFAFFNSLQTRSILFRRLPTTSTGSNTTRIVAVDSNPTMDLNTTTIPITPPVVTIFSVEMLMRLNKEYTTELNNPSSAVFKNFKSQIDSVLHEQYKGIPGYISGFVTRFSEGSVITDFVVNTTHLDFDKLAEENEKLPKTMKPVAPVIGSVSAFYKSPTSITIPDLTYTGNTMFLRCEPPDNFNLGPISSSSWKFKGREIKDGERIEITTSNNQSMLKVINVIPADRGPTSITIPDLTYTGNTMFLRCEPPDNFNLGPISSSSWKFKGREIKDGERIEITTSNNQSMLKVINVIPADRGLYSCTLRNKTININQEGFVTETQIIQAPVVRLQGEVNVRCQNGQIQPLKCCVQRPYTVKWFQGIVPLNSVPVTDGKANCIKHDYKLENCSGSQEDKITFICRVDNPSSYEMKMTMTIFRDKSKCDDAQYGTGRVGDRSSIGCDEGQEGSKTAICQETGEWKLEVDTCIVTQIKELLIDSQDLDVEEVTQFVLNLSTVVHQEKTEIANSSATISAIVDILNTIANVSTAVNKTVMQNVLETIDVLISEDARDSWVILNANDSRNTSSALLGSMETLSSDLDGEFAIATQRILLNRTTFNNNFMADLNSSVVIDIPNTSMSNIFITTILLSTLNNVMPPRNSTFDVTLFNASSNETAINAVVVLIKINATVQKVLLRYNKLNSSLTLNPQCIFWNFTLFDNFGAWDDEGCTFVSDINNTVTCSCNHLSSFSILMATDIPPSLSEALDIITYFGVGTSLASLVICLLIEGYVWKAITRNSTAFIRHVSLVNTALSLLIADICFIIGAFIAKNPLENPGEDYELPLGLCSTATFFMHFFYLALFFWMLVSGLLLFYRTVMVFSYMSKSAMLAIGFCLGYGCPLIIAVITVAVTAPGNGYIRKDNACWLNWIETKALLALVIPALTIVLINIFIVIVVLFKMLRRGVGESAQTDEKHTLVVIARCVIILTPLFGLTWSLGVGTMVSSTSKGLHIAFAFFNSLQTRSIFFSRLPSTSTGSNTKRISTMSHKLEAQAVVVHHSHLLIYESMQQSV